jgi:hypothetical protein
MFISLVCFSHLKKPVGLKLMAEKPTSLEITPRPGYIDCVGYGTPWVCLKRVGQGKLKKKITQSTGAILKQRPLVAGFVVGVVIKARGDSCATCVLVQVFYLGCCSSEEFLAVVLIGIQM